MGLFGFKQAKNWSLNCSCVLRRGDFMALLAEEVVEEWLNRQGYFTIRGIRLGVDEIDLVAVMLRSGKTPDCRHVEVQASMRPVSYISKVPKSACKTGRAANSATRLRKSLSRESRSGWRESFVHAKNES